MTSSSFPVLLIRPAYPLGRLSFVNSQVPLNLCYLAAFLRATGFPSVRILDCEVRPSWREDLQGLLANTPPRLVGITAFTPTVQEAGRIAETVRTLLPDVFLLGGGPHASALPERTLEEIPGLDAVAAGEGEETLRDLCDALRNGRSPSAVAGLVLRTPEGASRTPARAPLRDLDRLPFPARDLLDLGRYRGQVFRGFSRDYLNIGEILTSRGCPNRCVYCASRVTLGTQVRFRSPDNVLQEVRECMQSYGMQHFAILDDTFNLNRRRLFELCDGLRRLGVTWNCLATVSNMTEDSLRRMKESGCTGITFGIESGSPRILKINGKNVTREQAVRTFAWARKVGIKTLEADFMIGSHPSETAEDLEKTRELIRELKPDILSVQPLIPYPGTEAHRILDGKGLLGTTRWEDFLFFGTTPTWRLENLSSEELVLHQKRLLRGFYFRPGNLLRRLRKLSGGRELFYYLKVGMNLFRRI